MGSRRAAQIGASRTRVQPAPGRGAWRGGQCGPLAGPRPGGMGGAVVTVLVLVELDGGAPADASLRALTLARSLGDTSVGTVVFAEAADVPADALAGYGATDVYVIEPSSLEGYAPQAWARTLAGLATETGASAVLAAGTDRGNEVLAHLGAITGLPTAANCTLVTPDGGTTHRRGRHRG